MAGCGGAAPSTGARSTAVPPASASTTSASRSLPATSVRRLSRPPHRRRPRGPSPGTLPQTSVLPSARTRVFRAEMATLWRGIRSGSVGAAMPAFFPEAAYVQLKRIGDPQGDWRGRLVADYRLDVGAAHLLLAPHPGGARLLTVQVPASYAHWVPPGVCDNAEGYYEVPNARVVYRTGGGAIHSLGIASMISWRGVWYVVHLGAVLRPAPDGVVDDPSAGAGVSAYSSTC